jgi:hypothetical protein
MADRNIKAYPRTGEEALKVAMGLKEKYPRMFARMRQEGTLPKAKPQKKAKAAKQITTTRTGGIGDSLHIAGLSDADINRLRDRKK